MSLVPMFPPVPTLDHQEMVLTIDLVSQCLSVFPVIPN